MDKFKEWVKRKKFSSEMKQVRRACLSVQVPFLGCEEWQIQLYQYLTLSLWSVEGNRLKVFRDPYFELSFLLFEIFF